MSDRNLEKFDLLYDEYADKVFGFIISFNCSKHAAEEILCKVFLTVWGNIDAFDSNENKKLYMMLVIATKHIHADKKEFAFNKLKIFHARI